VNHCFWPTVDKHVKILESIHHKTEISTTGFISGTSLAIANPTAGRLEPVCWTRIAAAGFFVKNQINIKPFPKVFATRPKVDAT